MERFDLIVGTVASVPVVENESPFYLTFDVQVQGDTVPAYYVGDAARAYQRNVVLGDTIVMKKGFVDGGKLVFDFAYLEPRAAKGKHIDTHA